MHDRFGGFIIKSRWFVILIWLLVAGAIFWTAPSLSEVAKGDQASFLPGNSEATMASNLIKELYPEKGTGSSLVVTFNRKGGLHEKDSAYIEAIESYLIKYKEKYHIRAITSPYTQKELESSMISKSGDASLMIVNLSVPGFKDIANDAVKSIRNTLKPGTALIGESVPSVPEGLNINVTGDAALGQETIDNVNESMDLTMKITIVLVLLVLLLIYRSPIAPFVPLFTIGVSFLISRGIIAILTDYGLKVSSFTETFLIAVLFGAGTDYCLLLTSRFREEIVAGKAPREALRAAMPSSAVAIISSGATVVVGFMAMAIAKFGLYNTTGPSIAIGVAVTIIAVLTITPAILALLGERVFWPAHPSNNAERERQGSPFWNRLAVIVTTKPVRFIAICLILSLPFLFSIFGITRTFDSLADLPASSDAVKGFDVIKNNFDQGEMLPVKIVLKSDKDLWSNESLKSIDEIAKAVKKVGNVAKVRTATRPLGEQITETTLPDQLNKLSKGIGQVGDGLEPLDSGLDKLQGGVKSVSDGITAGSSGMQLLIDNTKKISDGMSKLQGSVAAMGTEVKAAGKQAEEGTGQLKQGLETASKNINELREGIDGISSAMSGTVVQLGTVAKQKPELMQDKDFATALGTLKALEPKMQEISQGLGQLSLGISDSAAKLKGTGTGTTELEKGIKTLDGALVQLKKALDEINQGQVKVQSGLNSAATGLSSINSGFNASKDGIDKLKSGLGKTQDASEKYSSKSDVLDDVFYLPDGALEQSEKLKAAMGNYISENGKGVTFDIVLTTAPYIKESLDSMKEIKDAAMFALKGSYLDGAELYVGGGTQAYSELRDITSEDFTKVFLFVLLGIFIVLVLLLRSIIAPLYLIFTIILSYAATMGLTYIVFQLILGYEGLTWSVPFFSFCILVALGVDYNIFLMSRVKEEYTPGDVRGGVERAVASTGKIITSCGIIMAGTFGALMASPVSQLVQIGFTAVVGLMLDTFIIRCLLVPAIAVKIGELNWWPGRRVMVIHVEENAKD